MNEDQEALLRRARESIAAAKLLTENGMHGISASRSYYAMFYVAAAVLEGDGLRFSSHGAVIGEFGRRYSATGRIPKAFHRHLIDAESARHEGDYDARAVIEATEAELHLERAKAIYAWVEENIDAIQP